MTRTRPAPRRMLLDAALACSVVALAGLASAVTDQPAGEPAPTAQPPLLRGPSVEDASIPGTARTFSMDAMDGPQARMLNREVPMGEFLGAFRALNAPETPEELHLSDDQRQRFQAIVRDVAQAQRAYMQSHREELTALGEVLGFNPMELGRAEQMFTQRLEQGQRRARQAAQGQPDMPPAEDAPPRPARSPEQIIRERIGDNPTPEQRAALERLRELRDAGPSMLEAQTLAWNVLNEPQQAFVRQRLDEGRARREQAQGEMYVEQMARQIEGEGFAPPPGAPLPAGGPTAQRLHQMIDEMTPQEQAMLLQFLETRWEQRRGARPGAPAGGRQPAPPPMDQIRVPAPTTTGPI